MLPLLLLPLLLPTLLGVLHRPCAWCVCFHVFAALSANNNIDDDGSAQTVGNPQLHAWWHLLTAAALNEAFCIAACMAAKKDKGLDLPLRIEYTWGGAAGVLRR